MVYSQNSQITLHRNPLEYPPKSIYYQGESAILRYLQETPAPDEAEMVDDNVTAHYGTKPGHFETSINHFPTNVAVSKVSE